MATKSNLITALNGFISAVVGITKHRNANNAIVDEIYPNSIIDNQTTETYTTSSTVVNYSISIVKSGNIAHISGSIQNPNHFLMSNPIVFLWKNSEFKPNSSTSLFFLGIDNSGNTKRIGMNNTILTLQDSLDALSTVYFDFKTYITQD